jgi:hypothetical protein
MTMFIRRIIGKALRMRLRQPEFVDRWHCLGGVHVEARNAD